MGRILRYKTAFNRARRSKGFGIHSPYAFRFVLDVLRERLPYYNYAYLYELRRAIIARTSRIRRHPRVMSFKTAKMLFRIANHFMPSVIMQVGTNYGYSTASVMSVSRKSTLHLYEPQLDRFPVVADTLQPFLDFITTHDRLEPAIDAYCMALPEGERPFVLVASVPSPADYVPLRDFLAKVLDGEGIVILRNLQRDGAMRRLLNDCEAHAAFGHIYTNEKLAVIVALRHLPLQRFLLWF